MRLASYNIRKAVGLDWRRDPDRVLSVVKELDADIVVLQEADKRVGRRSGVLPEAGLHQAGYQIAEVAVRPDSHGWHGNVILHRQGLPPIDSGRINLPSVEPRGAVRARFDTLEVVGVHLALTRGTRVKQMHALQNHAAGHNGPLIIAGDFNEWRAGVVPSGATMIAPGKSFHSARPVAALDRFFTFGPVEVLSSFVHHSPNARRASDHLPIVMDFRIRPSP